MSTVRVNVRYLLAGSKETSSAVGDDAGKAEALGKSRMKVKVGATTSASETTQLVVSDYPCKGTTDQFADLVLIFHNATTGDTKEDTERNVSLTYRSGATELVNIAAGDISGLASDWVAAKADRADYELQATSHYII